MKKPGRLAKIITVNLAVFCVGLLLIELALGGWLDENKLNRLNLIKDCELHYDIGNLYADPNPIITYSRDQHGLRGAPVDISGIDILTVGGSTTDQRYIRDGETWQDVLQGEFVQEGHPVSIANAGVDGQSTIGHIKNFHWWFPYIPDLAPRYILYYVGINDFHVDPGSRWDDLLDDNSGFDLGRALREKSVLWDLARKIRGSWVAMVVIKIGHRSIDFGGLQWTHQALLSDYEFMQPRLEAYEDRLRRLVRLTRDFGAKPLFVTQPYRKYRTTSAGTEGVSEVSEYDGREINGVDFFHMTRMLDGVTRSVANENGVFFIDLANHDGWVDSDYYDFAHMTPQGAGKVGHILFDSIVEIIPDLKGSTPPN